MFNIDLNSSNPVYIEITNSIIKMIINGTYKEGDKLPSIRSLSQTLSINHNTVTRAYLELEHRGYVESVQGKGMFIKSDLSELNVIEEKKIIDEFKDKVSELIEIGKNEEEVLQLVKEKFKDKE